MNTTTQIFQYLSIGRYLTALDPVGPMIRCCWKCWVERNCRLLYYSICQCRHYNMPYANVFEFTQLIVSESSFMTHPFKNATCVWRLIDACIDALLNECMIQL